MIGDKDSIRRDRNTLEEALRANGMTQIKGNDVRCTFHDDKSASGSIHQGDDAAWRFTCHRCDWTGDYFDLMARATGKSVEELLKETSQGQAPKRDRVFKNLGELREFYTAKGYTVEDTYVYGNDVPVLAVLRMREPDGKKKFSQAHPVHGGFVIGKPEGPMPLYGLRHVGKAHSILVCEGEKAVHAIMPYLPEGWAATTSPGGDEKADLADWTPLSGKNKVVLFPDADLPDPKRHDKIAGKDHMEQVRQCLLGLAVPPPTYWIDSWNLDLPPKGDAVEYLSTFADDETKRTGVKALLDGAEPLGVSKDILQWIQDVIDGKITAIEWFDWPALTRFTQALIPGTVTAICGNPECGKSLMVMEAMWKWHTNGVRCAVFELEDDKQFHIRRAIAQIVGVADMTQFDWIKANPQKATDAHKQWAGFMDSFEGCVWAAPDKQQTYADLLKWADSRAKAGCRIIVIDPITAVQHVKREIWEEDNSFLNGMKLIARDYGCSVILVTHPRKGQKNGSLDDLAGGAAFARFAHCVLWVVKHDRKDVTVMKADASTDKASINRTVQIRKARNARGGGSDVGFSLDHTFCFKEHGVIAKDDEETPSTDVPF